MEVTLRNIVESRDVIARMAGATGEKVSVQFRMTMKTVLDDVQPVLKRYSEALEELQERHTRKGPDGEALTRPDGRLIFVNPAAFKQEYDALLAECVVLPHIPRQIRQARLEENTVRLSGLELSAASWLVSAVEGQTLFDDAQT